MYHIWAVQCQIQLRRGQESNHNEGLARSSAAHCRVELANTLGRSLGSVQKRYGVRMCQRRLGFGEARRDETGLTGYGQGIEDGPFEQQLGARSEERRVGKECH